MKILNLIEHFFSPTTLQIPKEVAKEPTSLLNQVDLCFVIDTTGSMGSFIQAAKKHLIDTITTISTKSSIDLQVGLVEYRDHPPQETSFVTRVYNLTSDLGTMQKNINKLSPSGGGDAPEAVYDGIEAACNQLNWRRYSSRFAVLVGDAPPHGFKMREDLENREAKDRNRRSSSNYGDHWPNGCPCGLNAQKVSAMAENHRVTISAICMTGAKDTLQSLADIALATGGYCTSSIDVNKVINQIEKMLDDEFKNIKFDASVLEALKRTSDIDTTLVSESLGVPPLQVATSIARLGRRGFLQEFVM